MGPRIRPPHDADRHHEHPQRGRRPRRPRGGIGPARPERSRLVAPGRRGDLRRPSQRHQRVPHPERASVNFFGHAAVATSARPSCRAGGVLGAMLPDFATMSGARLAADQPHDATVAGGDRPAPRDGRRVPPACRSCSALMRELDERLAAGGCARGPRRAVAHIGVELLLDGILVDEATLPRRGMSPALPTSPDGVALARGRTIRRSSLRLLERLRTYGVPLRPAAGPEAISQRLHRMLSHRPAARAERVRPRRDQGRARSNSRPPRRGRSRYGAARPPRRPRLITSSHRAPCILRCAS